MHIAIIQNIIDKLRNKDKIIKLQKDYNKLMNRLSKLEQKNTCLNTNLENVINEIEVIQEKNREIENINKYIKGTNNKFVSIYENNEFEIFEKNINTNLKIIGNNNTIMFFYSNKKNFNILPLGLNINIQGDNNIIKIYDPNYSDSKIYMEKNNNFLEIKKTARWVEGAYFDVEMGASIIVGENCELGNGKARIFANGDYKNKHKIVIGSGTYIAHDTIIRNSDGECLIDKDTKEALSEPKDIIIGENCWITSRCTILKGTYLPNNTVVAACSLVNKQFEEEHLLLGGVPAKILKKDVYWLPLSYGAYMENLEKNYNFNEENKRKND